MIVVGVLFIVLAMLGRWSETALTVRPPVPSVPPPDSRTAFSPTDELLVPSRVGGKAKARDAPCNQIARNTAVPSSSHRTLPTPKSYAFENRLAGTYSMGERILVSAGDVAFALIRSGMG